MLEGRALLYKEETVGSSPTVGTEPGSFPGKRARSSTGVKSSGTPPKAAGSSPAAPTMPRGTRQQRDTPRREMMASADFGVKYLSIRELERIASLRNSRNWRAAHKELASRRKKAKKAGRRKPARN